MENQSQHTTNNDDISGWYYLGAIIVGILVFVGVWIYAMSEWGFLVGIVFGWIPAVIAGFIGGFLWPLIALVILWLIFSSH